jgi:hypothetical protein
LKFPATEQKTNRVSAKQNVARPDESLPDEWQAGVRQPDIVFLAGTGQAFN